MRILFDQGTPAPLRSSLVGHEVATAHEMGWSELSNGHLLKAAESKFDLLITTDQNLRHQQNLSGLRLAVLVLSTTSWPRIRKHAALVVEAVRVTRPATVCELVIPE